MKICSATICQDEEDFIGYSLHNPLLIYDSIVVVDGGSKDNTLKVIENKAKELGMEHKLNIYVKPFTRLNNQRNFYLEKLANMDIDYIHYIDADEVYKPEHLKEIKNYYTNKYDCILIDSHHYYIDWWHIAWGPETWGTSYKMPKVIRNLKGKIFYEPWEPLLGDHTLMIRDGKKNIYYETYWKNSTIHIPLSELACHHYGYGRGQEHQKKKLKFFFEQDYPDIPKEKYEEEVAKDTFFDKRFWDEGKNPNPEGIRKFKGTHPEIMKQHLLYDTHIIKEE